MGLIVTGNWTEGGGCADVGKVLHRGGSVGAPLRVRVVGHFSKDWEGAGQF